MNRVLGDYFETLLYKIFVSVDEKTSVGEVSAPLNLFIFLKRRIQNLISYSWQMYFKLVWIKSKTPSLFTAVWALLGRKMLN